MASHVFFVTTLCLDRPERRRTVGYFFGLEEARRAVAENHQDLYTGSYYPYVVIEAMCEGLYERPVKRYFFRWRPKDPSRQSFGEGGFVVCPPFPGHEKVPAYCSLG
jgi:hypothetical protein